MTPREPLFTTDQPGHWDPGEDMPAEVAEQDSSICDLVEADSLISDLAEADAVIADLVALVDAGLVVVQERVLGPPRYGVAPAYSPRATMRGARRPRTSHSPRFSDESRPPHSPKFSDESCPGVGVGSPP